MERAPQFQARALPPPGDPLAVGPAPPLGAALRLLEGSHPTHLIMTTPYRDIPSAGLAASRRPLGSGPSAPPRGSRTFTTKS